MAYGWAIEYVNELDWPRVEEFCDYMIANPPTHLGVKMLLMAKGVEFPEVMREEVVDDTALVMALGNSRRSHDRLPIEIQDWCKSWKKVANA